MEKIYYFRLNNFCCGDNTHHFSYEVEEYEVKKETEKLIFLKNCYHTATVAKSKLDKATTCFGVTEMFSKTKSEDGFFMQCIKLYKENKKNLEKQLHEAEKTIETIEKMQNDKISKMSVEI